jgi:CBS domain-containing protein
LSGTRENKLRDNLLPSDIRRRIKMYFVRDILINKGNNVWSVTPDTTMCDALKLMAEKNCGAVVVLENNKVIGIFSERDLARKLILRNECSLNTIVRDLMTSPVVTVTQDKRMRDCMDLMSDKHIRHLPVVEKERLIGLISIGDVVKAQILNREETIHKLQNYIEGIDYGL